ncbi:BRCA2, helical [Musa troglodytarum]|uniref:BRCA2, helical n=1 Tax=Musa troglodytarum TaxID=320322 RepID=A0A9E7KU13_9LILI|nr:BRCA2, helical [Musa troglodytarum]
MPETGSAGCRLAGDRLETGSADFRTAGDRSAGFRPGCRNAGDRFSRFPVPKTGSKAGGCRKPIPPAAGLPETVSVQSSAQPAESLIETDSAARRPIVTFNSRSTASVRACYSHSIIASFPHLSCRDVPSPSNLSSSKLPRVAMVAVEMEKGIETTSGGQDDRFPLFRTGSGKSVTIKESSLRKAAAVLEGNGINKGDKITLDVGAKDEVFPMFSTGSGKLVTVKESSIRKAAAIFIGENMEKESPNLLQCGRNNHDGYEKSILGNPSSTEKALTVAQKFEVGHESEIAGTSLLDCVDVNSVQRSPENCIDKFCSTGSHLTNGQLQKTLEHKLDSSDYGQSPVKFQTAGGRYISISNDAFKHARNLFGESDIEVSENNITLDQPLSLVLRNKSNLDDTFWNKDNISSPHSPHCEGSFLSLGKLSLIIRRMPEASLWRIFTPVNQKPEKMTFTLLVVLLKLLEGLNGDGIFITPLKGSTSLLATGSSKPSTTESSCCGRISTRYPFQLKRKNLKDFFGGPPTCQDLVLMLNIAVHLLLSFVYDVTIVKT